MPFGAIFLSRTALEVYAVIALALFALGLKSNYDEKHEAIGAARVQALWDVDKAERLRAYAAMTTQWVTAQMDSDANAKKLATERQGRIDDAKKRARSLPPGDAAMRFPASARGVLNDAISDSAAPAGSATKPATGPAAPSADSRVDIVTEWGIDVIGFYNECRDEVIGLQSFYHALQQAQPEVSK